MNHRYIIYTTVDITPTGVINSNNRLEPDYEHRRNQQRNYDTLCQVISLRANIHKPNVSVDLIDSIPAIFPNPVLPDSYNVWSFEFWCDRENVFGENHSALIDDLHMVPIVPALDETVPQFPPYFISKGELRNIYIP